MGGAPGPHRGHGFHLDFFNPIHTPGLSGSLYAVKDCYGFNPLFDPESGQDPEAALAHFLKEAGRRGLKVMLDLVINHSAIDSPLVTQHPEWYAKDDDGRIEHPGAIDPADATKVTVWGDLAELEYWPPPDPEGLLHYFDGVVAKYLRLGFMGFRADAAYKIPGNFGPASSLRPGTLRPKSSSSPKPWGAAWRSAANCPTPGSTSSTTAPSGGISRKTGAWTNTMTFAASRPPSASRRATTLSGWRRKAAAPRKWPGSATSSRPTFPPG